MYHSTHVVVVNSGIAAAAFSVNTLTPRQLCSSTDHRFSNSVPKACHVLLVSWRASNRISFELVLGSKYAALLAECHLLLLASILLKWDWWVFEWLLSKLSINTCDRFVMPTCGQIVILWRRFSFVGMHTTCWLHNLLLICHTCSKHVWHYILATI